MANNDRTDCSATRLCFRTRCPRAPGSQGVPTQGHRAGSRLTCDRSQQTIRQQWYQNAIPLKLSERVPTLHSITNKVALRLLR